MGEKRFYADTIKFDLATIKGQDYSHITKVLRMKEHDDISVFNPLFGEYEGEIEAFDRDGREVIVRTSKKVREPEEGRPKITAVISLIKNSNMDFVVEKITEAGADEIVPYEARRSVVKVKEAQQKTARWESIIYSAVKQCGRISIPKAGGVIKNPAELRLSENCLKLLIYENENEKYLTDALTEAAGQGRDICFVIGPEGGFEKEEADVFIKTGFIPVTLGKNILRAETAAIAACTVISMYSGRASWKA